MGTLGATVVGVTGSSGKTTTKNILRALLEDLFPVVASPSSFNNDSRRVRRSSRDRPGNVSRIARMLSSTDSLRKIEGSCDR